VVAFVRNVLSRTDSVRRLPRRQARVITEIAPPQDYDGRRRRE